MNLTLTIEMVDDVADWDDERHQAFYETAQMITGLIIYPILCVIGLTGNTLTLIVLRQPKMKTSTNVYLSALAVSDTLKLLNDVLYVLVSILFQTKPKTANNMLGYMYPFSHYIFNAAVCVTAWLTVCVAVERYVSVCHPTRARAYCTIGKARVLSALVFICMSTVAIPSAFRFRRVAVFDNSTNQSMFEMDDSSELLGRKDLMEVYIWVQSCLRSVIPLFVLISLNTCIIQALRKERVKGKTITARNRITFMLLSVIVVFLICITPDAILCFIKIGYVDATYLERGIRELTDTLLCLNSAVNFIIYCAFSQMFRDTFMAIFCHRIYERNLMNAQSERLLESAMEKRSRLAVPHREGKGNIQVYSSVVVATGGGEHQLGTEHTSL